MKMKKLFLMALVTLVLGGNVLTTQAAQCIHKNTTASFNSKKTTYTHMTTISGLNGSIALIDCKVERSYLVKKTTCDFCGTIVENWESLMSEIHSVSHN